MSVVTMLQGVQCKSLNATSASDLHNTPINSMRSMETVYSGPSSSRVLTRRKSNQKNRDRNPTLAPAVTEIKQRVTSARMIRIKNLQNQIGETQHRLAELMTENRTLKAMQRRHESALSRHEGPKAELPQLLNSHSEELRMWTTRCRNLQQKNAELQAKLKHKEQIIMSVTDQNKQLHALDKNKNLLERAALQERVKMLEERNIDKEKEIKLFVRRLQLAEKNYKTSIQMEQQKYRDLVTKIEMSEFLLNTENHSNSKKLQSSTRVSLHKGMTRNKSPSTRSLMTKSAGNLSQSSTATITLPPCADSKAAATIDEKINTVKIMPDIKESEVTAEEEVAICEVDLTRNCVDKSDIKKVEIVDEEDVKIKNGMHRARQPIKPTKTIASKLSPLHSNTQLQQQSVKKSEKKSVSGDESEFSDDQDFTHFYSDHNGTKMAQLLEHKMHIVELENKMKQNSLDSTGSRKNSYQHDDISNSSFSSHDAIKSDDATSHHLHHLHQLRNGGDNSDLVSIQRQIHESILHRESMLDEYCDRLVIDKDPFFTTNSNSTKYTNQQLAATANGGGRIMSEQSYQAINYHKTNGHATGAARGGRTELDPSKKTKLLAVLKNLDHQDSVEN